MVETKQNKRYEGLSEVYRPNPLSYDIVTGSVAMFKEFKKRNPQLNIDNKQYKQVIEQINLYYIKHLLDTGNMVFMPNGLGKMMVQKNQRKLKPTKDGSSKYLRAPINWPESYKQGKIIYYLNESTDGFTYRYLWLKKASYIEKSSMWLLVMTKEAKRLLKERIESTEKDYKSLYRELLSKKTNMFINNAMK